MKRVTIMINEEIDAKLRNKQAKEIKENLVSCSYSRIVNETLAKQLRVAL